MNELIQSQFNLFYLNHQLFNRVGLACKEFTFNGHFLELTLISNCGGIVLSLPIEACNFSSDQMKNNQELIEQIINSIAYKKYLRDDNIGYFKKSDLFHNINNKIVIPTQLNWTSETPFICVDDLISFENVSFYVSGFAHYLSHGNCFFEQIRAVLPQIDEFYLWDIDLDELFPRGLSQEPLFDVVNKLFEEYKSRLGDLPVLDVKGNFLSKPTSLGELFMYYRFLSIDSFGYIE